MKRIIIISLFFSFNSLTSQTSFQITGGDNSTLFFRNFVAFEDEQLTFFIENSFVDSLFVMADFNKANYSLNGILLSVKSCNNIVLKSDIIEGLGAQIHSNDSIRSFFYSGHILGYNINNGYSWVRYRDCIFNNSFQELTYIDLFQNDLVALSYGIENSFSIYQIEPNSGNILNNWGYQIDSNDIENTAEAYELVINPTSKSYIVSGGSSRGTENGTFILEIDQTGIVKNGVLLKDYYFQQPIIYEQNIFAAPNGNIILTGLVKNDTTGISDLILVQFDQNIQPIFSKRYYAENFDFFRFSVSFDDNSNIFLSSRTTGAFPTILAKLDTAGNILSESGFALYSPQIQVTPNGSLAMLASRHFDQDGNVFKKNIIAKTDSLGNIDGCENYEARLRSVDINIDFDTFTVHSSYPIPDLGWGTASVEPFQMEFTDFCDFPSPPHPNFHLPDTLCLGNCLATDSTNNANAHGVEWNLEGDDLQLKVEDSLQFNFCPTEVGTYTLRQTIWFLGVDYSFEKIVEIIPPLEVSLPNDTLFCDAPAMIELISNRPLQSIKWSSGETTSIASIYESGQYDVVADDGNCQASSVGDYEFIFDKIDTTLAVQIPDSVSACEIKLPFELRPESEYISLFQKENEVFDSVLTFSQSGTYEIKATIDGCDFSKKFQLKTTECAANIYVPSAFSPNDDGINDTFLPLGSGIEPIQLKIYDRWGGKLFESTETQIAWNGKFNQKSAPQGVYVFQFEYLNLLTGSQEELSGEVTVFR